MKRRHGLMALMGAVLVGVYWMVAERERVVSKSPGAVNPARRVAPPRNRPQVPVGPRAPYVGGVARTHQDSDSDILRAADAFIQKQIENKKIRKEHQVRGQVFRTPFGSAVKYSVFQGDLPVVGMRIEVRLDSKLMITKVLWDYRPIEAVGIERSGNEVYDGLATQLPAGYSLRKDQPGFSEIIYEVQPHGKGEHSIVVSALNQHQQPMNLIIRASDGRVLAAEAPRREVTRYGRRRPLRDK